MAFTGTPVVTSLGKHCVRITGVSLGTSAAGTIGDNGDSGAGIQLPATHPAINDDATWVVANKVAAGGVLPLVNAKGGTPKRITITNPDGTNATGNLEILIENKHSLTR